MFGPHDLGGKQGLGPIDPESESTEPVFHAQWEQRVFALTLATGMLGRWNIDESRFARERQHPVDYLQNSYYENWLAGLQTLLVEKGLISHEELGSRQGAAETVDDSLRVPDEATAAKLLRGGGPTLLPAEQEPAFAQGARVRVLKRYTSGHSRAPGYAQGAVGSIARQWGSHIFPDANAAGSRRGEHLYSVRFSAASLWGEAEDVDVFIDLWEPYLELA